MRHGALITAGCLAALLAGCAGAGTDNRVAFDAARYPVSLTSYVPGPSGAILSARPGGALEPVGTFQCCKRGWSMVWGLVPLHTVDFSPLWPGCVHVEVKGTVVRRKTVKADEAGRPGPAEVVRN